MTAKDNSQAEMVSKAIRTGSTPAPDDGDPQGSSPLAPLQSGRPTLKTIAAQTGFAVTTVSKALAGDPKIKQETRQIVAEAADQLGYVPDRAAQRLRTGQTNVIGLVIDPHIEIISFSGSMISGLTRAVRGTRYHITIMQYDLAEDPVEPIRHIVRNRLADGVIFARTRFDDPRVSLLLDEGFPFVTHGRTERNGPHPWVDYDNEAFSRMAVERLAGLGHRRIALVSPARDYTFSRHMIEGYHGAMAKAGLDPIEPPAGIHLNSPPVDLHRWFLDRLRQPDPPDAVICPGEMCAVAIQAAVMDAGLEIGRDIDLLAKQTSPLFDLHRPQIFTIGEDISAAGYALGRHLLGSIAGEPVAGLQTLIQPDD